MPRKKISLLLMVASLFISGCDQDSKSLMPATKDVFTIDSRAPIIQVTPGYKINDHGKPLTIFGRSQCQNSLDGQGSGGCIAIKPTDSTISVNVGNEWELWSVERRGKFPNEKILLKRPDGNYVVSWR